MENKFQHPERVCPVLNRQIRNRMQTLIDSKDLSYHRMMGFFEDAIRRKNLKEAAIWAYYITNQVIKTKALTKYEKNEAITGMIAHLKEIA